MSVGHNIIKHWKWWAVATALVSIIGWAYTQGSNDTADETRWFSTPKMRYDTETYMEQQPSPEQKMRQLILDSVAAEETIKNERAARKSRAMRDSIYVEETKARKRTDSIAILNADQMFQIKEQLKLLLPDTIND
jgi:hypothetical protein